MKLWSYDARARTQSRLVLAPKQCRDPPLGTFASRSFRLLRMTWFSTTDLTRLFQFAFEVVFDLVEEVIAIVRAADAVGLVGIRHEAELFARLD